MRSDILIKHKVSHRLVSVSPAVRLIEGKESYHSVLAGFLKAALLLFIVLGGMSDVLQASNTSKTSTIQE